ncbi:MAG TPA: NAD(P)-dependent oxidoreductase [bacterium]|jgi:precorrin-2 dehydrogenase/sirohydrochlorin ferrochelatase|nr:NAD(P)-dependent oxidoreductase [bacterium]
MPKPYFALNLDVVGKPCLVIGGDEEALEKSERLVEAEADLTVVAKRAIPALVDFLKQHGARLHLRAVAPQDIAGNFFVLNCVKTEPELSAWIHAECLKQHAIISAYDQPDVSNAVMMGLVRAGKIRIAIGSNGSSPGLVSAIRKAFERIFDGEFARYSESVAEQRQCHIDRGATPKQRKYRFKEQLKKFDIQGRIVYPEAYRKNLEQGVEQRADGLWYRKASKP